MKTVAIDFDGVIHAYSEGWKDGSIYDEPMRDVIKSLNQLVKDGYSVFILSTRSSRQIKRWLIDHSNQLLYMSQGDFYDQYAPMQEEDARIIEAEYEDDTKLQYKVKRIPFWRKFWNEKEVIGITKKKLPAHLYVDDRAFLFTNWHYDLHFINAKLNKEK